MNEWKPRPRLPGKHASSCPGYNERPCECGLRDELAAPLRDALREALNNWQGWVETETQHPIESDPEMARIAELRKLCGP